MRANRRSLKIGAAVLCALVPLALGASALAVKSQSPAKQSAGTAAKPATPEVQVSPVPAGPWTQPYIHGVWDPFLEMDMMLSSMRRLYEETTRHFDAIEPAWRAEIPQTYAPQIDLREEDDRYLLRADLPGLAQSDIRVTLDGRTLTISGQREEIVEEQEGDFLRRERVHGAFQRSMTLPGPVDRERAEASYADGVLKLVLPKSDEPAGPIEIPIG